jgi:hypothetical protein
VAAAAAGTIEEGTNRCGSNCGRTAGATTGKAAAAAGDATKAVGTGGKGAAERNGVRLTNGTGVRAAAVGTTVWGVMGRGAACAADAVGEALTGGAAVGRAARPITGRPAGSAEGLSTRTFFTSFLAGTPTAATAAAELVLNVSTEVREEAASRVLSFGTILTKPGCLRDSTMWKPVSSAL